MPERRPTFAEGDDLSAARLDALSEMAARANNLVAAPNSGLIISDGPAGKVITTTEGAKLRARITGGGTGGKYAWTKVNPTPGGGWANDSTVSGTTSSDPAYEVSGNTGVPTGRVVPMTLEAGEWRFDWRDCA